MVRGQGRCRERREGRAAEAGAGGGEKTGQKREAQGQEH